AEIAAPIVEQLKAGQEIQRSFIGIEFEPIDDADEAEALGVPKNTGALVENVLDGGAAEKAGIQPGDIITSIGGEQITTRNSLPFVVSQIPPGDTVQAELLRQGERRTISITPVQRPSNEELIEEQQQGQFDPDVESEMPDANEAGLIEESIGLQVIELTPRIGRQLGAEPTTVGVVVAAVDRNSDAARKGIRRGDIILSAQYQETGSIESLTAVIADRKQAGEQVVLLRVLRRNQQPQFVAVRIN
ncbi:MAG: PDZ domain-containing protein, partial [Pseudomonadota bacterium]